MKAKTQRSKKKHSRLRLIFSIFLLLLFISVLSFTVYIGTAFQTEFPSRWYDPEFLPTSPSFYVYRFEDRVGRLGERVEVTGEIYAQKQTQYHQYDNIPTSMIDAFVAIEDKRFFEHEGVDWYRTIAAGANYLLGFSDSFGASTITQQLVKNLTGNDDVTVKRKIQEILYALDLERNLDKKKIMELYLNVIHFSDNCDGIGMAAEHYFSKSPMELTVAECATIAAITNSPSYYNPIRNPENNLKRRDLILSQMYEQGFITQTEYTEAKSTPLALDVDESVGREGINSWYTDMVIEDVVQDLMNKYSMSRAAATHLFYTGGLQIDIAMDEEIQALVEDYYKTALELPKNGSGESAQSAIILIDAKTGDILGVAGAAGEKKGNLLQSFATKTLRSPGSTIKPLSVYAPAIEEGIIDWATVYDDVPIEFHTNSSLTWPKNATGVYRGLTNVSYAVAHSTNTVSIKVLERLGLERSFLYAKERFHLSNMIHQSGKTDCDVAALGLGQLNYGVTLREITNAYTAFADGGVYHACRSYYRVLDKEGTILLSRADGSERILSRETAAIMTKLLEGVITHGTSSTVTLQRVCECAGKTGTTNKDHDRWFIGYTPDVVCGVWCGYEYPEPIEGRNVCTGIWNRVMRDVFLKKGGQDTFTVPANVVQATYCKDSGSVMSEACAKDPRGNRQEVGWFVKGKEPRGECTCHVLCRYDTEHGGICHGHCPEECVQEVALIRVERHFPMQIYITDAQYVWHGDPEDLEINPNGEQPYFGMEKGSYRGVSGTGIQFNRSCTEHTESAAEEEYENESEEDLDLLPIPWRRAG